MSFFEISLAGMASTICTQTANLSSGEPQGLFVERSANSSSDEPNSLRGPNAYLYIMSGTMPTFAQLASGSSPNPASSGVNNTWGTQILLRNHINSSGANGGANIQPVVVDDEYYAATQFITSSTAEASGTASWWLLTIGPTSFNNEQIRLDQQMYLAGDISVAGGGGSLTLPSLNIIAGLTYEIGPIIIHIPRRYEW